MRVVFIGTGAIGLPALKFLRDSTAHELAAVVTQPDKPAGRAQRIEPTPIKAGLGASYIPILQPPRIKHLDATEAIRAFAPDVIVVMAYGQILPRAVLEIPKIACLNLHASLLPRHRGAAPIQAAIAEGDTTSGLTVMYMDEGLDTGDVLLQSRFELAPDETGGSLHDRLSQLAPFVLDEALNELADGNAPRTPQDNALATYASKLEREQGEINWSQPARVIERRIRAFDPWPGSYATVYDANGKARKLKIFSAAIESRDDLLPGKIDGPAIGTGENALLLREVQLEGKKRMSMTDFLRGNSWFAAARLR